jgi:hypothetical protein
LTPEEKAALLAMMYEQPDETENTEDGLDILKRVRPDVDYDDPNPPPLARPLTEPPGVRFETDGRYVTLTVDGKKVSVASGTYCKSLEKRIEQQDRLFLQMKSQVKAMRQLVNQHVGELSDVWRELDRKINLRDLP